MKNKKVELILFIVFLLLTIVFMILQLVWIPFCYFAVGTIFVLCGLYIYNRITKIITMKKEYDESLKTYLVELLNSGLISNEDFESQNKEIVAGYYKEYEQERKKQIIIVVIVCLLMVSVILSLIFA